MKNRWLTKWEIACRRRRRMTGEEKRIRREISVQLAVSWHTLLLMDYLILADWKLPATLEGFREALRRLRLEENDAANMYLPPREAIYHAAILRDMKIGAVDTAIHFNPPFTYTLKPGVKRYRLADILALVRGQIPPPIAPAGHQDASQPRLDFQPRAREIAAPSPPQAKPARSKKKPAAGYLIDWSKPYVQPMRAKWRRLRARQDYLEKNTTGIKPKAELP